MSNTHGAFHLLWKSDVGAGNDFRPKVDSSTQIGKLR